MLNDTAKTMDILVRSERTADRILQIKRELVMLDQRRQDTREALRELRNHPEAKYSWVAIGSMLVRLKQAKAQQTLAKGERVRVVALRGGLFERIDIVLQTKCSSRRRLTSCAANRRCWLWSCAIWSTWIRCADMT